MVCIQESKTNCTNPW